MAYPRSRRSRAHKVAVRTAGNVTTSSTAFVDVDTGLDITLAAQPGDTIEYGVSTMMLNEAVTGRMDAFTVVGGSPVNGFSGGSYVLAWTGLTSVFTPISGARLRVLTAADIAGGTVTVRLRWRVETAVTKTMVASATEPMQVWAKNLGPADST